MTGGTQLVIAAVLVSIIVWLRRPVASVTTDWTVDLSTMGAPVPSSRVENVAKAIARAEGFYVSGSIPQRARNPGNLKRGAPTLPGTSITQYTTAGEGWSALYKQLTLIATGKSAYYNPATTIRAMGQTWTATKSEQLAWSTNVANVLGVGIDTPLGQVLA